MVYNNQTGRAAVSVKGKADMTAARRKTRRTVARATAAGRIVLRSTAASAAAARLT